MSINLKVPELQELKPRITVIGVGGAGGNAVNNMIASGLTGVEFIVANTDAQALTMSGADHRIQMGIHATEGLGAGSRPEIGYEAAEEAEDEIRSQLSGSHMVFVAAGMGGGTGTGAAPVIAKIAQEEGVLTVGVVTKPFHFEGRRRMTTAEQGVEKLKEHVDTLIVIPNQNLFRIANERTTFAEAFKLADKVLHAGIACITDLIIKDGLINLDFADVRAVMNGMGSAVMGTGQAAGEHRALEAAEEAIANPLLDDISLHGAKGLLISITGGDDLTLYEVDEAASRIRNEVDPDANIIMGAAFDDALNGQIRVSIVASGVSAEQQQQMRTAAADLPLSNSLQDRLEHVGPEMPQEAPQTPRQQAEPMEDPREGGAWQTNGDVRIERRPPQLTPTSTQGHQPAQQMAPPMPPRPEGADRPFAPAPPANAPMGAPRRAARMPDLEEFPPQTQKEMQASREGGQPHGVRNQKRRVGFFERLTGITRQKMPGDSQGIAPSHHHQAAPARQSASHGAPLPEGGSDPVNKLRADNAPPSGGISVKAQAQPQLRQQSSELPEDIDIPPFLRRRSS